MRVAITGANGFIGKHLTKELARSYDVIGLDLHQPLKQGADSNISLIACDIRDQHTLIRNLKEFDTVYHLAGVLGTDTLVTKAKEAVETNIAGTLNLLDAARINKFRLVNVTLDEDWSNSYMITKNAAEKFVEMYVNEFGVDACSVKMSHVFGPYQKNRPVEKVVPSFIDAAMSNRPFRIYGSEQKRLNLIYVTDVVQALALLCEAPKMDLTYFAKNQTHLTLCELAQIISSICGSPTAFEYSGRRSGEPLNLDNDREHDQSHTNIIATPTSIELALRETIAWKQTEKQSS